MIITSVPFYQESNSSSRNFPADIHLSLTHKWIICLPSAGREAGESWVQDCHDLSLEAEPTDALNKSEVLSPEKKAGMDIG